MALPLKKTIEKIPLHTLRSDGFSFAIEDIAYNNPYDFLQNHRHNYIEIVIIEKGGGKQWIDFDEMVLNDFGCYLILPKQIHLLKRDNDTKGSVVQLNECIIKDAFLIGAMASMNGMPVVFENNFVLYTTAMKFIELIQSTQKSNTVFEKYEAINILQAFLYFLLGNKTEAIDKQFDPLYMQFINMVESNFLKWHTVTSYAMELNVTEYKLAAHTKRFSGFTPLQIIHNRIVLEAKRLIFFKNISIKEIAYELGFNYPNNFAQFIKNKTGFTATQLQEQSRLIK